MDIHIPLSVLWGVGCFTAYYFLMKLNGWLMKCDLNFRMWTYNFYGTDPWFVPRTRDDHLRFLSILATGWMAYLIYTFDLLRDRFSRR